MTKTEGSAAKPAELYRSIAEEAERRKISYKSVCEERGVRYDTFLCFRFRHRRKDGDGIAVRRIAPEPGPDTDRIEISVSTQGKTLTVSFRGRCSVEAALEALRDVQA